ncbi:MAG: methylornithine synthase PylB [Bacillota bacterium]|nr:methylornithine synthase PylB [Bacillota bacterium]
MAKIAVNESRSFDHILAKAYQEMPLTKEEILVLLALKDQEKIEQVYETARVLRQRYFGRQVFTYGFVYFSTFCRNDCSFCYYRKSNTICIRYRKETPEIIETAHHLAESGVHLLDLTMGEDPSFLSQGEKGYEKLLDITWEVKKNIGRPVMISPGLVSKEILREFKQIGVDWYACYQETYNRELFSKLRLDQNFDERLAAKLYAKELGMFIEEGILSGVGDSLQDVVDSITAMSSIGADQVRVMSFVPQEGTNMYHWPTPSRQREMLIIAVMRLIFPTGLIPASLDVDGLKGLKERLAAGANVITSIIPPQEGLRGVSQSTLDIDEGNRTIESIIPVLESCGLILAPQQDYDHWLGVRRKFLTKLEIRSVGR